MSTVNLVCGYAGTGKDTLFKHVSMHRDRKVGLWFVYAPPKAAPPFAVTPTRRIAFADTLKHASCATATLLDGTKLDIAHHDAYKNTLLIRTSTGEIKSLRQHYIDFGAGRRKVDPDVWCKEALDSQPPGTYLVTDWRYRNEAAYAKKGFTVHTHRLYRSAVPVASNDVSSEHDLDETLTDYLYVPSVAEFATAVKLFPQYQGYTLCVRL